VNPVGASEAGSFVTGPQGCGRYRALPNPARADEDEFHF